MSNLEVNVLHKSFFRREPHAKGSLNFNQLLFKLIKI